MSSSGQLVTYLVREKQVLSHPNCLCVIQMSVAKATAKRNNEYSKPLYHCDNVSNHWELIEGSLANDEILAAQNVPDLLII